MQNLSLVVFFGHCTPECTPEFRCECIVQQQLKDENACSFSLRVDLARVRWQQSHSTKSLFSGAVFGATFDGSVFLLHILTSNLTGFSLLCSYCLHPVGTIFDRAKAITLCDDCLSSRIFTGPSLASSTCTAIR